MALLYILIYGLASQGEVMLVRHYGRKHGEGGMLFNGVICLFAMVFFIISDADGLHFLPGLWKYGIVNAVLYGVGFYFAYIALRTGPFYLTQTIIGLNFVLPIFYGLIFLDEEANFVTYLALACTFVSFFLMICKKNPGNAAKPSAKGCSVKWLLAVLITLFSNGFISILAKMQQLRFHAQSNNEYMVITLLCASLFLLIFGLITERQNIQRTLVKGCAYGVAAGLLNGLKSAANLAAMLLLPLTALTPIRMAFAKPLEFIVSFFIYKERYTLLQYLSIGFGIISVILMQAAKYV